MKEDIVKAVSSIQKKYSILKKGIAEENILRKKEFEPLIKPLETLIDLTGEAPSKVKIEREYEEGSAKKRRVSKEENEDEELAFYEKMYEAPEVAQKEFEEWNDYLNKNYGKLTQEYLNGLIIDDTRTGHFDHRFGITPSRKTNRWKMGAKYVDFDKEDTFHVDRYGVFPGSRGLFELIFKKFPNKEWYNSKDLSTYKEILLLTSAHKQNYNPDGNIASSKGLKYRTIISPLFIPTGKGLLPVTDNKIDYVHWDDPNELVNRLVLLYASQEAGNNSHQAEIASIVEELREGGYIQ